MKWIIQYKAAHHTRLPHFILAKNRGVRPCSMLNDRNLCGKETRRVGADIERCMLRYLSKRHMVVKKSEAIRKSVNERRTSPSKRTRSCRNDQCK